MTIVIKDLDMNIELDKAAMASILGGWKGVPPVNKLSPANPSSAKSSGVFTKLLSQRRSSKKI